MKLELELSLKRRRDKERDTGQGISLLGERKAHARRLTEYGLFGKHIHRPAWLQQTLLLEFQFTQVVEIRLGRPQFRR